MSCDHVPHPCSAFQFEGSEPLTNSILGQRQRPTSDINNSSSISPAHPKVTRSISANQKQRRYSDHGGDDDGGGGVIEKPSKVTSFFPALRVLVAACCVGGSCSQSLRISQWFHPADVPPSKALEHSNFHWESFWKAKFFIGAINKAFWSIYSKLIVMMKKQLVH